ncbi:hypothetical protein P7C70_g9611, partial [Phenoliferia sp. Uapishka_3]
GSDGPRFLVQKIESVNETHKAMLKEKCVFFRSSNDYSLFAKAARPTARGHTITTGKATAAVTMTPQLLGSRRWGERKCLQLLEDFEKDEPLQTFRDAIECLGDGQEHIGGVRIESLIRWVLAAIRTSDIDPISFAKIFETLVHPVATSVEDTIDDWIPLMNFYEVDVFPGALQVITEGLWRVIRQVRETRKATGGDFTWSEKEIVALIEREGRILHTGDGRCMPRGIGETSGLRLSMAIYGWPEFKPQVVNLHSLVINVRLYTARCVEGFQTMALAQTKALG